MEQVSPQKPPEEIFPLEVWGMVLNNLESALDLENSYKTCISLAELLQPKRTTFLMSKIFPILLEKGYLVPDKDESVGKKNKKDSEINTILKMRLVSRIWKQSVDDYYQNHPAHNDINLRTNKEEDRENDEPYALLPYHFNLPNIIILERFLDKNFSPDSSPFITRYVKYSNKFSYLYENLHKQRFQTQFKTLLECFGSQIWACAFHIKIDSTLDELYKLVRSYLSLLPNLRSLTLHISGLYKITKKSSALKQLEMLLQNEPMPTLEQLKTLYMKNVPFPLNFGILSRNCQVKTLTLSSAYEESAIPDSIANIQTLHLEKLALFFDSNVYYHQLQKLTWPLKSLTLCVEGAKLDNVFTAVHTFKDTLEHLKVTQWTCVENQSEINGLWLDMPKLKKLQMKTPLELTDIDFLIECTALQEIELFIKVSNGEDDNIVFGDYDEVPEIQFYNCLTEMHKSNIWSVLPLLKLINVKTTRVYKSDYYIIIRAFSDVITDDSEIDSEIDSDIEDVTDSDQKAVIPKLRRRFTRRQNEKYIKNQNEVEMQSASPLNNMSPQNP